MTYKESIIEAMAWLGEQPDTIFIGQTVAAGGSYFASSLEKVPLEKRIEFPVAEELQLGASLGLALEGFCVVSIYPRIDFLLLAMNQLVNHIDKIGVMSNGKMKPRIIIRTSIGPKEPLDGGPQHTNDHTRALGMMCKNISVFKLGRYYEKAPEQILECYQAAYEAFKHSDSLAVALFVEDGQSYQETKS